MQSYFSEQRLTIHAFAFIPAKPKAGRRAGTPHKIQHAVCIAHTQMQSKPKLI